MRDEGLPVPAACAAAELSTSADYDCRPFGRGSSMPAWDEAYLANEIHEPLPDSNGSPPMTDELRSRGRCTSDAVYLHDGTATSSVFDRTDFSTGEVEPRVPHSDRRDPPNRVHEGWLCRLRAGLGR